MRGHAVVAALGIAIASLLAIDAIAQTSTPSKPSDSIARDASLRALANRLDLPLVEEAVAIFSKQLRRTLPAYFVNAVGLGANLGPQWKSGNSYFDDALRQVDLTLGAEEARGGPLLRLERGDLLYAVNVPWTQADIRFLEDTIGTPLGREAQRALDANAAQQTIATLRRRVAIGAGGEGIAQAFDDLDARAQSQRADATLMLLALRGADPVRAQRLQRLVESVTNAPSDALGARLINRLSQRLLDAAAMQAPAVIATIANFKLAYP
jgi:hypothetical protein